MKSGPGIHYTKCASLSRLRIPPWLLSRGLALVMALVMVFPLIAATPAEIAAIKAEIAGYEQAIEGTMQVIEEFYVGQLAEKNPKWASKKVASKAHATAKTAIKNLTKILLGKPKANEVGKIRENMKPANLLNATQTVLQNTEIAVQVVAQILTTVNSVDVEEATETAATTTFSFNPEVMEAIRVAEEFLLNNPLDICGIENTFSNLVETYGLTNIQAFGIITACVTNGMVKLGLSLATRQAFYDIIVVCLKAYFPEILVITLVIGGLVLIYKYSQKVKAESANESILISADEYLPLTTEARSDNNTNDVTSAMRFGQAA